MKRVLIVYGTTEGQTGKIARVLADTLRLAGVDATVIRAGTGDAAVREYDGIIVAASVHVGRYQKPVVQWVRDNAPAFGNRPTAFVSVCLGVLQTNDPKVTANLASIVQRFSDATGWRPDSVTQVAGALLYTRYGFFTRWIMKRIVAEAGGDTDTSRDYDYTDWAQVRAIAAEFARRLSPTADRDAAGVTTAV